MPFVGSIPEFFDDPLEFYTRTANEYGPVTSFTLGGNEFVQVTDTEYVKEVLVNDHDSYSKGRHFDELMGPMCGNGVLLSDGDFWQSQRQTLEPAFDPADIGRHCSVMTEYTQRRIDDWESGECRDIYEDLMHITLEIAGQTLFDFDIQSKEGEIAEALEIVRERTSRALWRPIAVPNWVPTAGNREYNDALDLLDEVAYDIIDSLRRGDSDNATIVDLLLDKDEPLSRKQIRDEVFTLLLAAHENTTLAATYTLQLLAQHPRAMAAVHDELDQVLDGDHATFTDLHRLTYLDDVLTEALRIYPPVYSMLRETRVETELAGYRIPAGHTVMPQQWVIHRDTQYYDDPLTFRPERWTEEFAESLPDFAYFPFGGGPRRCIASEFAKLDVKMVLSTLLLEWDLETTVRDLDFSPSISLRPGSRIEMVPRRR